VRLYLYNCYWHGCIVRAGSVDQAAEIVRRDYDSRRTAEHVREQLIELSTEGEAEVVEEWQE
jgi:hypothetical protein